MGLRSIESLDPGEYIAILGFKLEWPTNPWQPLCPAFDGRPLRVLAVSPPFIAVQDIQASRYALDSRAYELTKLNRSYAEVWPWARGVGIASQFQFTEKETLPTQVKTDWVGSWGKSKQANPDIERPDPDAAQCPRCGEQLVQHLWSRPEPGWRRLCKSCGLDAGPIDGGQPPQEQES